MKVSASVFRSCLLAGTVVLVAGVSSVSWAVQSTYKLHPRIVEILGKDLTPEKMSEEIKAMERGSGANFVSPQQIRIALLTVEASKRNTEYRAQVKSAEEMVRTETVANEAALREERATQARLESQIAGLAGSTDAESVKRLDTLQKQFDRRAANIKGMQKKLDEAHDKKIQAEALVDQNADGLAPQQEAALAQVQKLREEIDAVKLDDDLDDLKADAENGSDKAEMLEMVFDNKVAGQYLRQKMQGLLRSDDFCQASAQCKEGKNAKGGGINDKNFLNNVFYGVDANGKSQKGAESRAYKENPGRHDATESGGEAAEAPATP